MGSRIRVRTFVSRPRSARCARGPDVVASHGEVWSVLLRGFGASPSFRIGIQRSGESSNADPADRESPSGRGPPLSPFCRPFQDSVQELPTTPVSPTCSYGNVRCCGVGTTDASYSGVRVRPQQRHGGQHEQSIPSTHTPMRSREEISHVLGNRCAVDRRLMGGEVFRCAWREREDVDPSCRHANRRRDRLSIFRETVSFLFPSAVRAIRRCSTVAKC